MNEDLLHILSDSNKDIDNQKLMDYLSGKLSAEQKHEVEKWMMDNPFFNDAVEGLQHADATHVNASVEEINTTLRKYLQKRKAKREKDFFPKDWWVYVAVVLILFLVVIVYWIIKKS